MLVVVMVVAGSILVYAYPYVCGTISCPITGPSFLHQLGGSQERRATENTWFRICPLVAGRGWYDVKGAGVGRGRVGGDRYGWEVGRRTPAAVGSWMLVAMSAHELEI